VVDDEGSTRDALLHACGRTEPAGTEAGDREVVAQDAGGRDVVAALSRGVVAGGCERSGG
jgi:hypothetical protein